MSTYLATQATYTNFEIALFVNGKIHDQISDDKRHSSKLFIPLLEQLLITNNVSFSELSFCAVNCGPGPFSTLRSIIASVNGLHLASKIPLISIDGLYATFAEFYNNAYQYTVVLFNAFNNEVYYLVAHEAKIIAQGYKKIEQFLADIKQEMFEKQIRFIGNGAILYQGLILNAFGNKAFIDLNNPEFCSIEYIGDLGLQFFMREEISSEFLMPLHLKKHPVEL